MVRSRDPNDPGAGENGNASAAELISGCSDNLDEAKAEDANVSEDSDMIGACFDDRIMD